MCLPLPLHRWHVWCYVHRNIQHLFTWQMFSVCAVQRYNLPRTPQSTLVFLSIGWSSHAYATSQSSSLRTDQHHTSCRNTKCSLFASAANTCDTAVVFLWKASAVNASLPVDWAGMQLDLVCPVKCHWLSHFLLVNGKSIHEREFHRKLYASFCRHIICV